MVKNDGSKGSTMIAKDDSIIVKIMFSVIINDGLLVGKNGSEMMRNNRQCQ